jgi:mannose-6-phosphate isomerase
MKDLQPFLIIPEYRDYVWGGDRLRPGHSPTAEAWIVYENDRIAAGPLAGKTLAEATTLYDEALLGNWVSQQTESRFPLLIKLLDCAQWLSVQVHPDDEQAIRLEGPGHFGKTEAWYILDAAPGAQLIAGLKPGRPPDRLSQSIRDGTILDWVEKHPVQADDTVFMPAGTIHALGPGLLVYEVQQASDVTYRVYDWGRPQTAERKLHIEKSLQVIDPNASGQVWKSPGVRDEGRYTLVQCPYFTLELLSTRSGAIHLDTHGETFHALTVVEGGAQIVFDGAPIQLGQYQSVIVPAKTGKYQVRASSRLRILKSSVEEI